MNKPPEFNIEDSWPIYQERLERFFVAYDLDDDEKQAALLLTSVSVEVYQIVRDLCFPSKPEEKTFNELCGVLRQRFMPTVVVFRERSIFFEARQGDTETIVEWATRLKKLSSSCEFGGNLNEMVKNMFVVGLRRGPVFDRICEEEISATYDQLVKLAMKKEATLLQRGTVFRIQKANTKIERPKKEELKCFSCGKGDHDFRKCQYKNYVCKFCKKKGHLGKVCTAKNYSSEKKHEQKSPKISHLRLNNVEYLPPVLQEVFVNKRSIEFEVDTGSPVNAISKALFDNLFPYETLKTDVKEEFLCYNGSVFRALGKFVAEMKFKNHVSKEEIFVFDGNRHPLLGRQTMSRWGAYFRSYILLILE
ncbi:uncharacterized protein LOC125955367 [Anopheles darlingi]|uniref:uncharacterized protein LOC125955367 n=1 Tax=Anopheles darlingi TaxID=43151 RepID=UPI00210014E7|nr:uncharacterized protein LOC125955367 [Anopheles darlingi]